MKIIIVNFIVVLFICSCKSTKTFFYYKNTEKNLFCIWNKDENSLQIDERSGCLSSTRCDLRTKITNDSIIEFEILNRPSKDEIMKADSLHRMVWDPCFIDEVNIITSIKDNCLYISIDSIYYKFDYVGKQKEKF